MKPLTFFKNFVSHPANVGAIAPSGRELANAVTAMAGVADASVVIEYGAGTGVITDVIVKKLRPDATFFTMELLLEFVEVLRERYPEVDVVHDSAENARKHLEARGAAHCDAIVSGLPWASFNEGLQDSLLNSTLDVLRPGGKFATYMYVQSPLLPAGNRFLKKLRQHFSRMEQSPVVWRNLPPAIVYCGEK